MAYSEKQKISTMKYLKKLREIKFRVKQEEFERYEKFAQKGGYTSMRSFYMAAIEEKMRKIEKGS